MNAATTDVVFDSGQPYELHPKVALRPEPFGAMAYHYGNRRLNFLRHHDLVTVVKALPHHRSVDDTLTEVGIDPKRHASFINALSKLAASEFLIPRQPIPTANGDTHD